MSVALDGRTLTPEGVAAVARGCAAVRLDAEAERRNAEASAALEALVARGAALYGVTTGVGVLRTRPVEADDRADAQLRLLRSHAAGAGRELPEALVRAAMAVRANQLGTGGAGVRPALLRTLVGALEAGVAPVAHELGSLGTGDISALAEICLALLGEGEARLDGHRGPARETLARAGLEPPPLGARDGLGFMESNAVTIGRAALVAVDARRLVDAGLAVAALSFGAADADPVVLDPRVHACRPHPGQVAAAARVRALTGTRRPEAHVGRPVQDPYAFRCQPQVDGPLLTALGALEDVLAVELNAAGENALIVAEEPVALPNGNFHAAQLGLALDGLRAALAASSSLVAARTSSLLEEAVTRLPPMLAERPGADSGALILEYVAHAAAADVRALAVPMAAQTATVSAGVEGHASFAATGAVRTEEALARKREAVAAEIVLAVRALRMRGGPPAGADRLAALLAEVGPALPEGMEDRVLTPDLAAARRLVAEHPWPQA